MKRAGIVALLVGLFLCAPAQAVTLVTPDGQPSPLQRHVRRYRAPSVHGPVLVTQDVSPCFVVADENGAPHSDVAECSGPGWIGIARFDGYTLAHELGHQFDYAYLSDADRDYFMAISGLEGPWRRAPWSTSPNEVFAFNYAACATTPTREIDRFGRRVCAFIRFVASHHNADWPRK